MTSNSSLGFGVDRNLVEECLPFSHMGNAKSYLKRALGGWLFKSPLAGGGWILWPHHYRPHRFLYNVSCHLTTCMSLVTLQLNAVMGVQRCD